MIKKSYWTAHTIRTYKKHQQTSTNNNCKITILQDRNLGNQLSISYHIITYHYISLPFHTISILYGFLVCVFVVFFAADACCRNHSQVRLPWATMAPFASLCLMRVPMPCAGWQKWNSGKLPQPWCEVPKRQQLPEWLQKLKWPSQSEKDGLHTGCGSWGSGRTKPKGLMANTARPRAVLKNQEKDSQKESRTEWEGSLWGWKYARNQEKCIWPQHHQSHVAWAQSARCRCICTSPSIWHRRRVQDEAWQRKGQNMARHSWRWSTLHRSDVFRHCFQMVSECFWWLHMDTYGYFIIIIYIYISFQCISTILQGLTTDNHFTGHVHI